MFHVGKVIRVFKSNDKEVIGADSSVQATVQMWDSNLLTIGVKAGLGDKIKESDVVLIDYSPASPNIPVPKQIAVKILRGETAKKTWKDYIEYFETKKRERETQEYPAMANVR